MNDFTEVAFGEHLKLTSGFPFASSQFSDEGFPLIRIRDVLTSQTETYFQGAFPPGYVIKKGDILIGMDGDFHVVKWHGRDALLNQRVLKVDVQNEAEIVLDYLFYWLGPFVKKINDITAATTVKHLSTKDLIKARAKFPKVAAQRKIAAILTSIDTAIEKTEALIEKYQQIKAGLMHDLFTRGVLPNGQLRPPRELAPELYQETAIGWIPKDWESVNLGRYIEINLYGPRFDAGDYDETGNVKTIRGTDFSKDGEIKYSQAPVARLPSQKINRHILKAGDVVVVTTADCGLTAVFEDQDFCFIPSAYAVKYRFLNSVNPYFIKYFMQTDMAKRQVNKYVRQGTLGNLPGSDLLRFSLGLPLQHEQNVIVLRLDSIKIKIATEQKILDKLLQQKLGSVQDLLTGKVPVKVDNETSPETESTT
jgi:type I restriction enzyme S subunit